MSMIDYYSGLSFCVIPAVAITVGFYSYVKAKKDRMSQAIGFALMPGLWFGGIIWCLLTGQFGLVFLIIGLIGIFLACLYFSHNKLVTPQN
ncbi:MAG: hypothetical protein II453_00810 [Alphaproteobacteria bacterium]|nr:hypothetical protein [Alphaproteobacteria bacterium]